MRELHDLAEAQRLALAIVDTLRQWPLEPDKKQSAILLNYAAVGRDGSANMEMT